MEYYQYMDLDDAANNIANAMHLLNKFGDGFEDKDGIEQAKRHLMEAGFWIAKVRGDL